MQAARPIAVAGTSALNHPLQKYVLSLSMRRATVGRFRPESHPTGGKCYQKSKLVTPSCSATELSSVQTRRARSYLLRVKKHIIGIEARGAWRELEHHLRPYLARRVAPRSLDQVPSDCPDAAISWARRGG